MRTKLTLLTMGASLFLTVAPVWAHHAFAAEFDSKKPVKLRGKLTKWEMINPHSWFHIEVKKPDGSVEKWMIEAGNPHNLFRRGVSKDVISPGMEILVDGYQAKDGTHRANGRDLTLPNGSAARIAGAVAGIARETAAADDARRLALRSVAFAYLRTLYAQERIELLRGSETIAADVMTVADRRNAAGDIAILDVNIAKIALARARAARSAAEAERTIFAGELQRLLGIPPGNGVVAAGSLRLQRQPELANLLAAVSNRPDLRGMEADIRDAEADIRLGRATSRPDIGLGARVKREEGHKAVLGELTFTLPFFNSGQELRTTGTARVSRVRLELETTRASIESEVRSLFAAFVARQTALRTFEQDAMPGMDENDALARRSFEVGQISLPELLFVRRELVDARLEYLNRQLEVAEAAIEQDAAAGVLQ